MKKLLIFLILVILLIIPGWFGYHYFTNKNISKVNLPMMIKLTSSAFSQGGIIPQKYSCDGEGINPPLALEGVPDQVKSLVLIFDDPDAPGGTFTHWLVWNIDPKITEIAENSIPQNGVVGRNSGGKTGYFPPCPPSGTHRYIFKIFALDSILDLPAGSNRAKLESAMQNHIIDQAELQGKYSR